MRQETVLDRCEKYIKEHFRDGRITVYSLANEIGCNPSYLSRKFKMINKVNLMEYLRSMRMEAATEYLEQGDKVIDVEVRFGYSKNGFTKAYKKVTGVNPNCVKNKVKEKSDGKEFDAK